MKILSLCLLVACIAVGASAQDDEPRPAPARGLLKRGPLAKGKQTTTTTTPAPQDEGEYVDEGDYAEEPQEPSTDAPSSTTEGKKLVGSGVRPFRSNSDLIEILKKKRAQAAKDKANGHSSSTTSSPAQDSLDPTKITYNAKSNKKRFQNSPVTREVAAEEAPVPKPSRGRFGRPSSRSNQEAEEEPSDVAPARGRTFRRGGN